MDFVKEDFKNLKYYPFCDEFIVEKYPKLLKFKEFKFDFEKHKLSSDKVHRYILAMYQDTVLSSLSTVNERKVQAARLAGFNFTVKGVKFGENVEKLLNCQLREGNELMLRVCKEVHSHDYTDLVIYTETLDKQRIEMVDEGSSAKDISTLMDNIKGLRARIEELTKRITNQDFKLEENLYESVENDIVGQNEEMVELLIEGKIDDYLVDPYE
jgi:hypothetical protein